MSTVMNDRDVALQAKSQAKVADDANAMPKVPWLVSFAVAAVALAAIVVIKGYQHAFSWNYGLDSASPEFQIYWMRLLYIQLAVIFPLGGIVCAAIWFTRDRDVQQLSTRTELGRYYTIFGMLTALALVVAAAAGLFVEADASWHQVVIRDTDFTPTHIFLFYLALPVAFVGLAIAWVWVHTRLPSFVNRISLPFSMLVGGFMMVLPVVAFNEWGHTFFYAEELFSSPVHWFFVLFGFAFIFVSGFVLQCLDRMRELTQIVSAEEMYKSMQA